jgi:hypothetical protein
VLDNLDFIPNGGIDLLNKLIAKEGEETVELLYSRSGYGTDKVHTSKEKTDEFCYPVVYTVNYLSQPTFFYSSTNQNGHFDIPKVLWSNGVASSLVIDLEGQYGLTQFSYAITDSEKNLHKIYMAMNSEKFIELMKFADGKQHKYKYKVISTFRKDFWKEFINE